MTTYKLVEKTNNEESYKEPTIDRLVRGIRSGDKDEIREAYIALERKVIPENYAKFKAAFDNLRDAVLAGRNYFPEALAMSGAFTEYTPDEGEEKTPPTGSEPAILIRAMKAAVIEGRGDEFNSIYAIMQKLVKPEKLERFEEAFNELANAYRTGTSASAHWMRLFRVLGGGSTPKSEKKTEKIIDTKTYQREYMGYSFTFSHSGVHIIPAIGGRKFYLYENLAKIGPSLHSAGPQKLSIAIEGAAQQIPWDMYVKIKEICRNWREEQNAIEKMQNATKPLGPVTAQEMKARSEGPFFMETSGTKKEYGAVVAGITFTFEKERVVFLTPDDKRHEVDYGMLMYCRYDIMQHMKEAVVLAKAPDDIVQKVNEGHRVSALFLDGRKKIPVVDEKYFTAKFENITFTFSDYGVTFLKSGEEMDWCDYEFLDMLPYGILFKMKAAATLAKAPDSICQQVNEAYHKVTSAKNAQGRAEFAISHDIIPHLSDKGLLENYVLAAATHSKDAETLGKEVLKRMAGPSMEKKEELFVFNRSKDEAKRLAKALPDGNKEDAPLFVVKLSAKIEAHCYYANNSIYVKFWDGTRHVKVPKGPWVTYRTDFSGSEYAYVKLEDTGWQELVDTLEYIACSIHRNERGENLTKGN